jgi:hypothetical protein
MDPDPDPGTDLDPDIFVIDLLKMITKKFLLLIILFEGTGHVQYF